MEMTFLTDNFSVSPQLDVQQIALLAQQEVAVLLCNRPDGEETGQPEFAAIAEVAEQAGMEVFYLPMTGPQDLPAEYIETLQNLLASERRIHGYCRTGNRCSLLWQAATSSN